MVIRYLNDENVEVLYPDGSFSSRNNEREWVKVGADGSKLADNGKKFENLRISTKTDLATKNVTTSRVDFVTIVTTPNGKITTTHADGTNIIKDPSTKSVKIISPENLPNVTYSIDQNVSKTVQLSNRFKVTRKTVDAEEIIIVERPDLKMTLNANGNGFIKFSTGENALPNEELNTITLNWKLNTFEIHDFKGYKFILDDKGSTNIIDPAVPAEVGIRKFGPSSVQKWLEKDPLDEPVGNTPRLFCILPENQGGFELLRDSDVQKHYTNQTSEVYQDYAIEEGDKSVSLSSITPTDLYSKNPIYVYRYVF